MAHSTIRPTRRPTLFPHFCLFGILPIALVACGGEDGGGTDGTGANGSVDGTGAGIGDGDGDGSGASGNGSGASGNGSGASGNGSGASGNGSGASGNGSGGAGNGSGGAGNGSGGGGGGSVTKRGTVLLFNSEYIGEASAAFGELGTLDYLLDDQSCSFLSTHGACSVKACAEAMGDQASAGKITITDGQLTDPLELTPNAGGAYPPYPPEGDEIDLYDSFFDTSKVFTIKAAGGVAPAFNKTLTSPSKIPQGDIKFPCSTGPGLCKHDVDASYKLTWESKGSGQVKVFMSDDYKKIECTFSRSAGEGTIPAAALAALGLGPKPTDAVKNVFVYPVFVNAFSVDGWEMQLVAVEDVNYSSVELVK